VKVVKITSLRTWPPSSAASSSPPDLGISP
jgi:hypothetical protein